MTAPPAPPARTLARYRAPLALLAGALLVLGGLWSLDAATRVERERRLVLDEAWSDEGVFTYAVPVAKDSPVFVNGTVLGMGEPAYFSSVSPRVLVNFTWRLAEPATPAEAAGHLKAVVQAAAPDGRAYWTLEEPLANATGQGPVVLAGVVDLEALDARVLETVRALGMLDAKTRWTVVATVAFAASAPWGELRQVSTFELPLERSPPLYVLPSADDARALREHGEPREVVQEHQKGLAGLLGAPLPLLVLGAGGALGAALASARRKPSGGGAGRAEPEGFLRDLDRHREWVVEVVGPVPPAEGERVLDLDDLDDLVAFAAEARTRVLLDRYCRVFYVHAPGATYRYARHGLDLPAAMAAKASEAAERPAMPIPDPATKY